MFIWMKLGIEVLYKIRLTTKFWETVNPQGSGLVFSARMKVSQEKDHLITI